LQQTTANAEQIRDIEEKVQSLSEVLAPPVGDQDNEEKARRNALGKSVTPFPLTNPGAFLSYVRYL
jgi:hypothetical protein